MDSNVWLSGLAGERALRPTIDAHGDSTRDVRVGPYVFREVLDNVGTLRPDETGALATRFATVVHGTEWIDGPSQAAVRETDLSRVRSHDAVRTLAAALDIQAKDAPVLASGYDCATSSRDSVVYTADSAFGALDAEAVFDRLRVETV